MTNESLLQVLLEYDWLGNKEMRKIYNCSPATASKRLSEVRIYAEQKNKGSTVRYVHRKVPTQVFLDYLGKTIEDLIKYQKQKKTIEDLLKSK